MCLMLCHVNVVTGCQQISNHGELLKEGKWWFNIDDRLSVCALRFLQVVDGYMELLALSNRPRMFLSLPSQLALCWEANMDVSHWLYEKV